MITFRRERPGDEEGIRRVNEETFMVLPLREGALDGRTGVVRYLPEFREV
jgi:predicted N-acetyltransferase YhbS